MESMRARGVMEYLEILWRKKWLICLVAVSMLIATSVIIRRIPNFYESSSVIVISGQANDEQLVPGTPLGALMQRITSHGNLADIARRYNLYRPAAGKAFDPDAAVGWLRKDIKLDIKMRGYYPDAPESLTLKYRYTDPKTAQSVVGDLVSMFEQANVTMRDQATKEFERLSTKIAEVETQMQNLGPQREQALLRSGSSGVPATGPSAIRAQRLDTTNSIDALSDKELALERKIDEQKRQIAEEEKLINSAKPSIGAAASGAYGVLLTKRAEIEGQIKDLATTSTEKNPKLIQARTQLAEINRAIEKLEADSGTNPATSPEAKELRKMQGELQGLLTDLEITRRDMNRKTQSLSALPEVETPAPSYDSVSTNRLNEAKAEYERLLARYSWLRDKQDSMQKLSGGAAANIAMFQVVDAPVVSRAPVGPNRNLLRLLGLGMAAGLGLLVAFAREIPRLFLISNESDVEYYLGTPVLAMIPETLTPLERSLRRRLWALRWLGLSLLSAMMIPVFVVVLDRIQIFQMLGSR
jgi:uncharacterized protein involved in exopolysaccharide biosynthesis